MHRIHHINDSQQIHEPGHDGHDHDRHGRGHGPAGAPGERRFRGEGGGRPGGRGGPGHRGRHQERQEQLPATDAAGWFAGRLPDGWFTGTPRVEVDRDEITVVGALPALEQVEGQDETALRSAEQGRISRFREETRGERIAIAKEAERRYGRSVAWGASVGGSEELFTTLSVPVMTRLRQSDRQVLDTLVDSGVARSRADALAWCVRLVGQHSDDWLAQLREALQSVEQVRATGPTV